jgi:hypothetical protein
MQKMFIDWKRQSKVIIGKKWSAAIKYKEPNRNTRLQKAQTVHAIAFFHHHLSFVSHLVNHDGIRHKE